MNANAKFADKEVELPNGFTAAVHAIASFLTQSNNLRPKDNVPSDPMSRTPRPLDDVPSDPMSRAARPLDDVPSDPMDVHGVVDQIRKMGHLTHQEAMIAISRAAAAFAEVASAASATRSAP